MNIEFTVCYSEYYNYSEYCIYCHLQLDLHMAILSYYTGNSNEAEMWMLYFFFLTGHETDVSRKKIYPN